MNTGLITDLWRLNVKSLLENVVNDGTSENKDVS